MPRIYPKEGCKLLSFLIIMLIVSFVTADLKIRFDRYFAILLLMFVADKLIIIIDRYCKCNG